MSNFFVPIETAELDWHQDLPFSIQYDDVYHSSTSGIEQSRYVFIEGNNLISRWQNALDQSPFTIAETGFGTGLNFLLTWQLWEQYAPEAGCLHFISCEKHPLTRNDLIKSLANWPQLEKQAVQLIEHYPVLTPGYHHLIFANGRVRLTLMLGDALECYEQLLICGEANLERSLRTTHVNAWYLDGFAPAKNQSMWSDSLMRVIAMLSQEGSTLATYTAAAIVKENLRQHGFMVEKKKGFGPKRHMLSAYFSPSELASLKKRHTPWHAGEPEHYNERSALIIGAGLAGCFTAHCLAKRGWKVTLIDELNEVGQGASANQHAVLFPKLSAYNSPLTQFMLTAFLYASREYQAILSQHDIGVLNGSLLLAYNQKEQQAQASLEDWLNQYPSLGTLVNAQQASELAGIPLEQSGLFIPLSGWINSPDLCQLLIRTEGITLITDTTVDQLVFDKRWRVNNYEADVLILANGYKVTTFPETESLPIKPIRGQMTAISATSETTALRMPLCADGHVLPAHGGVHYLGASYELKTDHATIKEQDDLLNLDKLMHIAPDVSWSHEVKSHWAGVRATTTDYLPIVGRIANVAAFNTLYAGLESNAKRWIAKPGPYYPGLYACTGFGSRGLTTIPLCAEWLAALINNEMTFLPRNLQQALSPARFLRKDIVRGKVTNP
ncbi:MAG: bifunctional tRNA (5-methylaminomethyl-2-thiouridine)(34)-methyltransferase MnmD/FAD-dependent 5-carboxymethylaminomethyl-2-thiouridine(34) oxidoreductase MnmC [Legionella sp.]|uniref:bifunctional tRNA (5-methylaminomethyl-2-thiouridine)(34)-methyltransferase MnmD/FAD-dependent 5-carboxymethylaminomethyl-2-thiouridine(34) oxidoreductase MnmC n=1 Tax=Legionella sp. TaxID=459 RepID=UPI0028466D50|nr:bifunctional tRNA (5-methylaminomethyl-2-thiouridine)(34)-methyltransferase MnmD/FAD-dependent 5-carboxymethylaminomethyl-2-thiouridine(34) oxidoreductase MnmC [Legionella sp.]